MYFAALCRADWRLFCCGTYCSPNQASKATAAVPTKEEKQVQRQKLRGWFFRADGDKARSLQEEPQQQRSPRGWHSPVPRFGLRRAPPVSRTCHAHKRHTRARFLLLLTWCCCIVAVGCGAATTILLLYCCLALSSLVTCNVKTKEKNDKKEKKKNETRVLVDTKRKAKIVHQ